MRVPGSEYRAGMQIANDGFVIPTRFRGPPESGNGGWVSGSLAEMLDPAATVTVRLRTPPPLERPLRVSRDVDVLRAHDGQTLVAEASLAGRLSDPGTVRPVTFQEALAAGDRYPGRSDHPFPSCFACGTGRDPAQALCLRTGALDGPGKLFATAWTPNEVTVPITWAALDCPGAWAGGVGGRPMVLGTMTAQVDTLPTGGRPHVVVSWVSGQEGRKLFSHCLLYGPDHDLLAHSEATWIVVDPASVRPH